MNSVKDIKLSWTLFFVFLLFAIYVSTSYGYGISDHNEQIPIIKRMIDSSYLKNDWFVNQNEGFTVRYYFSYVMAYLTNFADLPIIYFSVYVITLFFIIAGIYLISHFLFNNNLTSFLTIFLILFGTHTSLGGNWIVCDILIPTSIATPLALFAIYFFMKKRLYISFLLLGIASLFQILIGMLIAAMLVFYLLYLLVIIRDIGFKKILLSIVCYLSFATWNILPVALLNLSSNVSGLEVMKIIGYVRHPWHYMPFQFSITSYLLFISIMCLFILSLKYKPEKEKHKMVMFFISTVLVMCVIGTVFVEIIPILVILKLQLFKIMPYLILFIYIYIANYFRIALTESTNITNILINIGVIISFYISYCLIISSLLYILYEKLFKRYVDRVANKIGNKKEIFLISLLATITSISLYFVISSYFYKIYLKILLILTWLLIFSFIVLSQIIIPKLIKTNKILVISLLCMLLIAIIVGVYSDVQIKEQQKDFNKLDAYEWIRLNTPEDAVFIIPPYIEDFRLGANRAIIVDFKAFTFKDQSIIEWRSRIADVTNNIKFKFRGNRIEELREGFESLNESDFIRISKKYHAQYLFIEKPKKLNFKELYENDKYIVYIVKIYRRKTSYGSSFTHTSSIQRSREAEGHRSTSSRYFAKNNSFF